MTSIIGNTWNGISSVASVGAKVAGTIAGNMLTSVKDRTVAVVNRTLDTVQEAPAVAQYAAICAARALPGYAYGAAKDLTSKTARAAKGFTIQTACDTAEVVQQVAIDKGTALAFWASGINNLRSAGNTLVSGEVNQPESDDTTDVGLKNRIRYAVTDLACFGGKWQTYKTLAYTALGRGSLLDQYVWQGTKFLGDCAVWLTKEAVSVAYEHAEPACFAGGVLLLMDGKRRLNNVASPEIGPAEAVANEDGELGVEFALPSKQELALQKKMGRVEMIAGGALVAMALTSHFIAKPLIGTVSDFLGEK